GAGLADAVAVPGCRSGPVKGGRRRGTDAVRPVGGNGRRGRRGQRTAAGCSRQGTLAAVEFDVAVQFEEAVVVDRARVHAAQQDGNDGDSHRQGDQQAVARWVACYFSKTLRQIKPSLRGNEKLRRLP